MSSESEVHKTAAQMLLNSLANAGDQLFASFSYGRTEGDALGVSRGSADVFVKSRNLTKALIYLRSHGAPYLEDLSLDSIGGLVADFLQSCWADVVDGSTFDPGTKPFGQCISSEALETIAIKLSRSPLFQPADQVMLFPLDCVAIRHPFFGKNFGLMRDRDLKVHLEELGVLPPMLNPKRFPPFEDQHTEASLVFDWLRVNAPQPLIGRKRAAAIMAALSLTTTRRARYSFGSHAPRLGHCLVGADKASITPYSRPLAPPLSRALVLEGANHPLLAVLDHLFSRTDAQARSHVGALEYFHRAWFGEARERFPLLCMALDALVRVEDRHNKAAVDFVSGTLGASINSDRLGKLISLRGAVIHGAAPDVYESRFYTSYYRSFNEDPISDMERVVAACLRKAIFRDDIDVQDPLASVIQDLQNSGKLPKKLWMNPIIAES